MRSPFQLGEKQVHLGGSIGDRALGTNDTGTADELLRNADVAMYTAKSARQGPRPSCSRPPCTPPR